MLKEKAQAIAHSYIDPDHHEKVAINLEKDIVKLVQSELRTNDQSWESIIQNLEKELAIVKKRCRIIHKKNLTRWYSKKNSTLFGTEKGSHIKG